MYLLHRIGFKSKFLSYLPFSTTASKEEWDLQYSVGGWDQLNEIKELAHYSIITGYCTHLKPDGAILDIGCGEGILAKRLPPDNFSSYVGIDISREAILRAEKVQNEKVAFVCDDAMNYTPERSFDLIIFSECLYYFKQSVDTMRRYEKYRSEKGYIIVSMVSTPRSKRIWKAIGRSFKPIDETRVSHLRGREWIVRVF
ncbi:class I SAM-dependent methyltransferase [Candidatus Neomarinimicrobiota bacterium]